MPPTADKPLTARFAAWDRSTVEDVLVRLDGDGLTAEGRVVRAPDGTHDVHWVLRLDEAWRVRQLLLFRDLDEPDLWLGHDGRGRWGEVNGAHRTELDGCTVVDLACTPLTTTVAVKHLDGLAVGSAGELKVVAVDPATLGVVATRQRWTRLAQRRWHLDDDTAAAGGGRELVVDEDDIALDDVGRFRRLA